MPSVRTERIPVQALGLGILGFDHLQLVYVTSKERLGGQEDWFVIEGLREASPSGLYLAVEGRHGGTTLAEANGGAMGEALAGRIGTAEMRGSHEIASGAEAPRVWATFVAHATDIDAQRFPYIAYSLPSSPLPTINSSSLVNSLLHYAGIDPELSKPHGLRLSPGGETLLGSSGDDVLAPVKGFTSIVAGDGADWLTGSFHAGRIDKLYGGRGDDHFQWSTGVNIIHGGQPELAYAEDGRDTVDYSGVRYVTLRASAEPLQHKVPDFVATFDGGEDRLFSIEEIVWDERSDHVLLGKGAGLIEMPMTLTPGKEESGARGDTLDLSQAGYGLLIDGSRDDATLVSAGASVPQEVSYRVVGAEWIIASPFSDHIRAGSSMRGIEAGDGDDLIDARRDTCPRAEGPRGFDLEIDGGTGADTIISGAGRIAAKGGEGPDRFVLGAATIELIVEDAEPHDRVSAPHHSGEVSFATDEANAGDLLIHVGQGDATTGSAIIRIRNFRDGDLGLLRNDPGTWTSEAAVAKLPHGEAAFDYAYSEGSATEPEWWWVALQTTVATDCGYSMTDAPDISLGEILLRASSAGLDGCDMDDDPCSW